MTSHNLNLARRSEVAPQLAVGGTSHYPNVAHKEKLGFEPSRFVNKRWPRTIYVLAARTMRNARSRECSWSVSSLFRSMSSNARNPSSR